MRVPAEEVALDGSFSADAVVRGEIIDTAPMTEHPGLSPQAEISCTTAVKVQFQAVEAQTQRKAARGRGIDAERIKVHSVLVGSE
jgi:hypothetical protein